MAKEFKRLALVTRSAVVMLNVALYVDAGLSEDEFLEIVNELVINVSNGSDRAMVKNYELTAAEENVQ